MRNNPSWLRSIGAALLAAALGAFSASSLSHAATADAPTDAGSNKKPQPLAPLDRELLDKLRGEDIGEPSEDAAKKPDNKLAAIAQEMRAVQQRLADQKLDGDTRAQQQQIAKRLAAALEELQRKSQAGAPGDSSSAAQTTTTANGPGKTEQPDAPSSDKPGDKATAAGETPAKQSDPNLQRHQQATAVAASVRAAMEKAIDHLTLPEKEREQMLSSPADDFLPAYEATIKKYFERLSQDEP